MWNEIKKTVKRYRIYVVTLLIFATWLIFFDKANIINWINDLTDVRNKKEQKKYYEKEIERITENINELNVNDESLEKYARENLYFKNDDEDVYVIEEKE
jgi:cell division protein FtsB